MSAIVIMPSVSFMDRILHVVMAIGFGRYSALVANTPVVLFFA